MNVQETSLISLANPRVRKLFFVLMFLVYLTCTYLIPVFNRSNTTIELFHLQIRTNSLCGILNQLVIVIMVCFVIFFGKLGLITSLALGFLNLFTSTVAILKTHELNSIAGIMMILIAYAVNAVIYSYSIKFNKQNTKLQESYKNLNSKQEALHRMAYFDYLTELPNRRNIVETISSFCDSTEITDFKLIVIDITNINRISDVAGYQKGDDFLQQLVFNWSSIKADEDILGRIDGTKFALIIPGATNNDTLYNYINEFKQCLTNKIPGLGSLPWTADSLASDLRLCISANFGIVSYPEHGTNADELLQFANTALTFSKEEGRNAICYFNQSMYKDLLDHTIMESALSNAIDNGECFLVFQPQYEASSKTLRGFETLVRWNNPLLGFVPPSVFIPMAEENGFILTLGEWILRTALEQFQHLNSLYPSDVVVSVNLSVLQILHPDFLDTLKQVLSDTGFNPNRLELEITESIFISSKEKVVSILNEIKALDIQIALDDFGTSYSSLSYINALPLDIIKMDKSFVDTITKDRKKAQLVDTILAIAKQLDYKVVAEGVETSDQLEYLQERTCEYIQGYLWGKPMSLEEVNILLCHISELAS
ncbi:MAG: EAL domain-containing protein [bacterium]|nr:EAL domain-containing protein [bacterium]